MKRHNTTVATATATVRRVPLLSERASQVALPALTSSVFQMSIRSCLLSCSNWSALSKTWVRVAFASCRAVCPRWRRQQGKAAHQHVIKLSRVCGCVAGISITKERLDKHQSLQDNCSFMNALFAAPQVHAAATRATGATCSFTSSLPLSFHHHRDAHHANHTYQRRGAATVCGPCHTPLSGDASSL